MANLLMFCLWKYFKMLRLFIEDNIKGYIDTYDNVYQVEIRKIDKKNYLIVKYNSLKDDEMILLSEIKLCFLVDINNMHEYFRYEKN